MSPRDQQRIRELAQQESLTRAERVELAQLNGHTLGSPEEEQRKVEMVERLLVGRPGATSKCIVCGGPIKQGPHPLIWFHDNSGGAYAGQQVASHDAEPVESTTHAAPKVAAGSEDELVDEEPVLCPACDGPAGILGKLGNRTHYSCRNCGAEFSGVLP